jgi:hypothetical protein
MAFSDTVKQVIELATAINDYWERELPKRHRDYPIIRSGEDSGPPPREEAKLRDLLHSLPPDDVYRLLALMYLGRGDYNAIGFEPMSRELTQAFPTPERAIRQMMAKGPLAEYLADGLREMAAHGIDIDKREPATT